MVTHDSWVGILLIFPRFMLQGNGSYPGNQVWASCVMPGCQAPIGSKGKQDVGAFFSAKWSIKMTTAVKMISSFGIGESLDTIILWWWLLASHMLEVSYLITARLIKLCHLATAAMYTGCHNAESFVFHSLYLLIHTS